MGLDMYLKADCTMYASERSTAELHSDISLVLKKIGLTRDDLDAGSPCVSIAINVGYWRKANSIHNWFVENVQDGVDNCQESYVDRAQLQDLKDICNEVLQDNSKSEKLLPPKSGFFFGSTDMGPNYILDLEHTVAIIDKCLSDRFKGFTFYYRSSW